MDERKNQGLFDPQTNNSQANQGQSSGQSEAGQGSADAVVVNPAPANIGASNSASVKIGDQAQNQGSGNSRPGNNGSDNGDDGMGAKSLIRIIAIVVIILLGAWYLTSDSDNEESNQANDGQLNVNVDESNGGNGDDGDTEVISDEGDNGDVSQEPVINDGDSSADKSKIVAYFSKNIGNDCGQVEPLSRDLDRQYGVEVVDTVIGLLVPLSDQEKEAGYTSSIPEGTYLNNVHVDGDGLATARFSSELNNIGGSCAVIAVRSQIEETLKQFSYVNDVVICVMDNCNQDEILQP